MHNNGSLRGPLRSIIKSIGSPLPAPGVSRRYVSSAHVQYLPENATPEIGGRIPHVQSSRSARAVNDTPRSERATQYIPDKLEEVPLGSIWAIKDSTKTPQPDLNHRPRRLYTGGHTRSYEIARKVKSSSIRHQVLHRYERHGYDDSVAWPVVLDMLSQATISGAHMHKKRMETVQLPDGKSGVFKGKRRAAIAEIMQRTGSHVMQIAPDSPSGRAFDTLTLYGQPHENMEAMKLLPSMLLLDGEASGSGSVRLTSELDNTECDASQSEVDAMAEDASALSTRPASSVRTYWYHKEAQNMTAQERLALRPQIWNTLKFTEYVDLLTARAPMSFRRSSRRTGVSTDDINYLDLITHELCELFLRSPTLKAYVSSDATDAAFTFLLRHGKLSTIHRIMSAMERNSDCSLTVSNFNVLFAHAAKSGDVHNFKFILEIMLRHQIRPTYPTWLRFHQLVCTRFTPKAAAKVTRRMRQKGLLASPKAIREMADNMILPALTDYMKIPKATISHLLRAIDKTVNTYLESHPTQPMKSWLTVSAANKMINILLSEGREEDALAVLNEIYRRGERIRTDTLNTFLTSKARAFDLEGGLAILQHFRRLAAIPEHAVSLDALSFHLLFNLAHRNKFYNTMRVIWRYACVSGQMPSLLPQMVQDSLYSHLPSFEEREKLDHRRDHDPSKVQRSLPRLTQMDTSFGLWGKFAIGAAQGLKAPNMPVSLNHDEVVMRMVQRQSPRELTSFESSVIEFARAPRPESLTGQLRPQTLKTAFQNDLNEHLSLTPVLPFLEVFRRAWELDKAMKKARLDSIPKESEPESGDPEREQKLRTHLADMLENMLLWGLHVPMKVGTKRANIRL
nr:hypothetical protein CFP56_41292 [Quercus suber]